MFKKGNKARIFVLKIKTSAEKNLKFPLKKLREYVKIITKGCEILYAESGFIKEKYTRM